MSTTCYLLSGSDKNNSCGGRVSLARELQLSQIIIESNALIIVEAINLGTTIGEAGHIVQGIQSLLRSFSNWKIQHLERDYNCVVRELAQLAKSSGLSQTWIGAETPLVQQLLQLD